MAKPITLPDVESMRRSLAMAPNLTTAQTRSLLDETERLLRMQAEVEKVVVQLRAPFGDVRVALNDLAKLVGRE